MEGLPQPPEMVPQFDQQVKDAEQIRLLVIFHYVLAGLMAVSSCLPIIHLVIGWAIVSGKLPMPPPSSGSGAPPIDPVWMGWFFVVFAGVFILVGWAVAILVFLAGRSLSARRNWTFVFVVSCVQCLWVPLGTALGVFTLVVLQRPAVKALFGDQVRGGGSDQ
ncbi:hypothetical protein [Haloferula sp.]|uniref:hypothetical protein n=1 Tax=Haloferula sp. TaxID=2497595 RepID=UPI003C718185